MQKIELLLGRFLLSVIFLVSGFGKVTHWSQTAAGMAGAHLPAVQLLLVLSVMVEIVGGLLLLFGIGVRYVAVVMMLWLIPVTLVFHNFWAFRGSTMFEAQVVNFLKNLAIMGGLLVVAAQAQVPAETRVLAQGRS
jgi:putative oxidoreductase